MLLPPAAIASITAALKASAEKASTAPVSYSDSPLKYLRLFTADTLAAELDLPLASQLSVKKDQPDNHQDDESSCCGSAANTRCSSNEDFEEASTRTVDEARGRLRNLRRTSRSRHASVSAKRAKARLSAKRNNSMGPSPRESKHFEEFQASQQFECQVDVSISSDGGHSEMEQGEIEAADEDQDGTGDLRPRDLVNSEACSRQEIAANYESESVTDVEKFEFTKPALFKLLVKPANMSVVRCLRNIHPRFQLHPRQAKTRGLTYQEEVCYVEVPVMSTETVNVATDAVAVEVASTQDIGDQEEETEENEGSGAKGPIHADVAYHRCGCCLKPVPPKSYAKYEDCREQESQPPKESVQQRPEVAKLVLPQLSQQQNCCQITTVVAVEFESLESVEMFTQVSAGVARQAETIVQGVDCHVTAWQGTIVQPAHTQNSSNQDASYGGNGQQPGDESSDRVPSGNDNRSVRNNGGFSKKNQRPMNNQQQQQQQNQRNGPYSRRHGLRARFAKLFKTTGKHGSAQSAEHRRLLLFLEHSRAHDHRYIRKRKKGQRNGYGAPFDVSQPFAPCLVLNILSADADSRAPPLSTETQVTSKVPEDDSRLQEAGALPTLVRQSVA